MDSSDDLAGASGPGQNADGPVTTRRYRWVAGHLRVVGVVLPVAFVLTLEAVRFVVDGNGTVGGGPRAGYRIVFVAVTLVAIVGFSLAMFRLIDRAQSALRRQNRELAATNDVARSIRGEARVERIIDTALDIVLSATGARYAAVTVFPPDGSGEDERTHTRTAGPVSAPDGIALEDRPSLELPLFTGSAAVGRLDLWLPPQPDSSLGLAPGTLHNIGSQLASAIQLGQLVGDLHRRKNEGHAFYDILLQISHHTPPVEILGAVVQHARELLQSDGVVMTLSDEAARAVEFAGGTPEAVEVGSQTRRVTTGMEDVPETGAEGAAGGFDVAAWSAEATATVRGPIGDLGQLWVGRREAEGYTDRDRGFLSTLSGFAAIAITSAQLRENGRQRAVLAERERIAREMHDSLAQVLGSTHLRLRVLEADPAVGSDPRALGEVSDLADTCQEAYRDVREAILGLRDSSKTERGLEGQLENYLSKYSQQSQISTRLENGLDRPLALSPRCEVHIIRVIQEALTNVRKHSGASEVVVRIIEDGPATTFIVEDNGHGFDAAAQDGEGFGLFTMRDRLALLHGELSIQSAPGKGTRVTARVPERSAARPSPVS